MKTKNLITSSLIAIFTLTGITASFAGEKKSHLNAADTQFVKHVGESGLGEVEIAKLATGKAQSGDVKAFATTLVADHTKLNEEVTALAKTKAIDISATISAADTKTVKELETKFGADFDKAWVDTMVSAHEKCVEAFEKQEKDKDTASELKQWVAASLPTLRAHLAKAKELKKALAGA